MVAVGPRRLVPRGAGSARLPPVVAVAAAGAAGGRLGVAGRQPHDGGGQSSLAVPTAPLRGQPVDAGLQTVVLQGGGGGRLPDHADGEVLTLSRFRQHPLVGLRAQPAQLLPVHLGEQRRHRCYCPYSRNNGPAVI